MPAVCTYDNAFSHRMQWRKKKSFIMPIERNSHIKPKYKRKTQNNKYTINGNDCASEKRVSAERKTHSRTTFIYFIWTMNKCLLKTECCADEADGAFEIRKYFYQLFNAFHYLVCLLNTQSLNDPMRMFVYCLCCMHRKHVCVCVPLFHAQKRSHWFAQCSLVFHQHFCWLVQNIDSSGKYYSLCSCLIAFICLFSVFHGSDECLHFAETRQAPSQNWAVHVCALYSLILFVAYIL